MGFFLELRSQLFFYLILVSKVVTERFEFMTRKEKPSHSVCVLADVTSKGSSSFQSHSKRIDRYSNARKGSEKTIHFLRRIYQGDIQYTEEEISTPDAGRLLRRMESCSQWLFFRHYYTVGEVRLAKVHILLTQTIT